MARARNIKPDFFKNEDLAQCEHGVRLLFAGLWCLADREGRLQDRPMRIKAEVFPYESPDVDEWLNTLSFKGFIVRYTNGGNKYIQIVNFKKHQNPHIKEAESTIPAPDAPGSSRADSPLLIPDSLIPEKCAEPSAAAPCVTLPLNDKTEFPIFDTQIAEWQELYPAADVRQELRNMRGWLIGNPTKRKTKSGILRFVTSWLAKEQNRGGLNGQAIGQTKPNAFDRTKQRIEKWERENGGIVLDGEVMGSDGGNVRAEV